MEPDLGKKYSITKRISKGKFGNVYLGIVTKTQEKIAIKQSILNLMPTTKPQQTQTPGDKNQNGNGSSGLGQNIETIKHEAEMKMVGLYCCIILPEPEQEPHNYYTDTDSASDT
jgi:serine/threonine protein kinase